MASAEAPRGAYGYCFASVDLSEFQTVERDAHIVGVSFRDTEPVDGLVASMDAAEAVYVTAVGTVRVCRRDRAIVLPAVLESRPRLIAHPFLSLPAATLSIWDGRSALHAGAFVVDGRAWAVLGAKTGGKSTLLAALASLGVPVVTDDLLVVDDGRVAAGPRSIDLREGVAARFGATLIDGVSRYRLEVAPVVPSVPLAGFIALSWCAGEPAIRQVSAAERIGWLQASAAMPVRTAHPADFLDLAAMTWCEFARDRSIDPVDAAKVVLDQLSP